MVPLIMPLVCPVTFSLKCLGYASVISNSSFLYFLIPVVKRTLSPEINALFLISPRAISFFFFFYPPLLSYPCRALANLSLLNLDFCIIVSIYVFCSRLPNARKILVIFLIWCNKIRLPNDFSTKSK